jgi:carbonic anhydrase/acetyltransferase-like protein (isoleucine patch superfamily)
MPLYALDGAVPHIHPEAYVHPDAVLIGEVHLGAGASVWPSAVIRADSSPIVVGARTSVQDGSVLHTQVEHQTRVGADCVIGHLAHLESCIVEDCVLIGSGAVVLERAVLRTVSFVAAGALVRPGTEVPTGTMALGIPATLRPGVVTPDMILHNVGEYVRHVAEHRGSRLVALDDCRTEDVMPPSAPHG